MAAMILPVGLDREAGEVAVIRSQAYRALASHGKDSALAVVTIAATAIETRHIRNAFNLGGWDCDWPVVINGLRVLYAEIAGERWHAAMAA